MIKRIRPPYLAILCVILAVLGILFGASFWRTRRSPDFYEDRGDRLAEAGDETLAAMQYGAAALRASSTREQARLLIKRGKALGRTRHDSLMRIFKDAGDGLKAITGAMLIAPELYRPTDIYLEIQYRQTDLLDTLESWRAFDALLDELEAGSTENLAPRKYRALSRFRRLCRESEISETALRGAHDRLAEALADYPANLDLAFNLQMAKILLAERLAAGKPDEARGLRAAGVEPWSTMNDGWDDLRQADAAVLGFLAELLAADSGDAKRVEQLRVILAAQLGLTPDPRARFRAAKALLQVAKVLPAEGRGPVGQTLADIALNWLRELRANHQQETLATYLILLNHQATASGEAAAVRKLLEAHYERKAIEEGLFERTIAWLLSQAASRHEMKRIFDAADDETDHRALADLLVQSEDELHFFQRLREFDETPEPRLHFFQGIFYGHDLQLRRGLLELLLADELAEGSQPTVKLATGALLLELGEAGAAGQWLEDAWRLRHQLAAADNRRLSARLAEAYLAADRLPDAERLAGELQRSATHVDEQLIAGRIWRELSLLPDLRRAGWNEEFANRALTTTTAAAQNAPTHPQAAYELGLTHLRLGNREAAGEWFERAVRLDPAHASAFGAWVGILAQDSERHPEIATLIVDYANRQALDPRVAARCEKLVSRKDDQPAPCIEAIKLLVPSRLGQLLALCENLVRDGQPQQADKILDALIVESPNHERVVRAQFDRLLARQAYEEVLKWIDPVARPRVLPTLLHSLRGELELLMRQPYNAAEHFRHALRTDPLNSKTHFLLGQAHTMAMLNDQAIASFSRALEIDPGNPGVLYAYHIALRRSDRETEARDVLQSLARRMGRPTGFVQRQADYGMTHGYADPAMAIERQPVERAPDDDRELRALALASQQAGDREKALEIIARLVADETKTPRQWLATAEIMAALHDDRTAADFLDQRLRPLVDTLEAGEALAAARFLELHGARKRGQAFHNRAVDAAEGTAMARLASRERIRWLIAEGRIDEAKREADNLLSTNAFPDTFSRLGQLFSVAGHWTESLALLEKGPGTVEILGLRGRAKFVLGEFMAGDADFARAVELSPSDPRPYIWRAGALLTSPLDDAVRRAEMDLRQAIALQPELSHPHSLLAELFEREARYADAERIVADMVQRWPNREAYRLWRCRLALASGKIQAASSTIAAAANMSMTSPEWGLLKARLRILEGEVPAAVGQILESLVENHSAAASEFAANLFLDHGFIDEAAAILEAWSDEAATYGIQVARAVVADRRGDEDACLAYLQKAMDELPKPATDDAFARLANVLPPARLARLADGVLHASEPDVERIFFLASFAESIGAYREAAILARAVSQMVSADNPAYVQTRLFLANLHQLANQAVRAEQVYLEVLQFDPGQRVAQNNLAYLYATRLNKPEEARRLALVALAGVADGSNPRLRAAGLDTLALAQMELAEYDDAEENLSAAAKLAGSPEIRAHRGLLATKRGDADAGRRWFERAWQMALRESHTAHEAEGVIKTMQRAGLAIDPQKRLALARRFAGEGKRVVATELLAAVPAALDADPDIAFARVEILLSLQRDEQAGQVLRRLRQATAAPEALAEAARYAHAKFPQLAVSIWRDLAEKELPVDLRETVGRQLLQARVYDQAANFYRDWLAEGATAEAVVGYLVARLAIGDPPATDQRPALVSAPGGRMLLAVFDGDLERVADRTRLAALGRVLEAEDLLVVGRHLWETFALRGLDAAVAVLDKALEKAPGSPPVLRLLAEIAEADGRIVQAVALRRALLRSQPLTPAAVSDLGRLLALRGEADELRDLTRRYRIVYATHGWYQTLLGEWAVLAGEPAVATAAFAKAFAIENDIATLNRLAMHGLETGAPDEAARLLDAHADRLSNEPSLLALRARAAFVSGAVGDGVEYAGRALARDVPMADKAMAAALYHLAIACPPDVVGELLQGWQNNGVPATRIIDFLTVYFKSGARLDVERLTALDAQTAAGSPIRRHVGLDLVRALLAEGRVRQADERLGQLAAEYRDDPRILERLADFTLHHGGGAAAANNYAVRAVAAAEAAGDPAVLARALTTLGRILLRLELINPARRTTTRGVRLDPQPDNLLLLAEILAEQGGWLGAEKELNRAVEISGDGDHALPEEAVRRLRRRIEERR